MTCAEPTLRKTLTHTLGKAKLSNISSEELMKEMERTAVAKCSELMNLVQLMDMQQERDEPFRSFVARCKGQANVCNFKTPCPGKGCGQTVSNMDSTILIAVVKGLEDLVTKGEVLSKVEKLNLDDTITFVEAREIGKCDLASFGNLN